MLEVGIAVQFDITNSEFHRDITIPPLPAQGSADRFALEVEPVQANPSPLGEGQG